ARNPRPRPVHPEAREVISGMQRPVGVAPTGHQHDHLTSPPPGTVLAWDMRLKRYFSGLSRNTYLLALASLFADISTEMLYPILPIFLTGTLGATATVVGIIDGIAQAIQNVVQGFSGWLSDKL